MTRSATHDDHRWSFFRAGGVDQVKLETGADLDALAELDQKLWVALACPTAGLQFDPKTLAYIDADGDGRIRAPEIVAATSWATSCLKNSDQLLAGSDALPLSALDESNPDGARIAASARQILNDLGRPEAREIKLEDTADTKALFAGTPFNGDGIITAATAANGPVRDAITDILKCCEPVTDRSGDPGIDAARVEAFFGAAQAFADWRKQAEDDAAILPLGDATAAASGALSAVEAKVEDFFARCRLAAFDSRAVDALNREESEYLALAAKDLSISNDEVAGLPLARVAAAGALPLKIGVNPAWAAAVGAFRDQVVTPLLGDKSELTEAEWGQVRAALAPYRGWSGGKAGSAVEPLGLERVQALLASGVRAKIDALIAQDESYRERAEGIDAVDKLLHFNRHLVRLLNNFVNFSEFYARGGGAIFQAGTLFLDRRSCDLCIQVVDAGKHGLMAPLSRAYIAYCACTRKKTGETMTIAAAFTGGDSDFLMVGRNGVFYDRAGNDWDATITKIVEAPLSIPQAFWSPYKRVLRSIEDQVAKRAEAADKEADGKLGAATAATADAAKGGPAAAPKPKFDVGVVAALGVAVGGIVAALGAFLQVFFGLGIWMPLGLIGLMLLISGPSMLIAWLKLRQRNIGPLLDANGWAVNTQAKVNIPFGASLTSVAELPAGSDRDPIDPYAARGKGRWIVWGVVLVAIVAGLWFSGIADSYLPEGVRREPMITPAADVLPAE
jgi:hypothetical protein